MADQRLQKFVPGRPLYDKYIWPESAGRGGCDRRTRFAREEIGKIAEENQMPGLQFNEEHGVWSGHHRCSRGVRRPFHALHDGEKMVTIIAAAPGKRILTSYEHVML